MCMCNHFVIIKRVLDSLPEYADPLEDKRGRCPFNDVGALTIQCWWLVRCRQSHHLESRVSYLTYAL